MSSSPDRKTLIDYAIEFFEEEVKRESGHEEQPQNAPAVPEKHAPRIQEVFALPPFEKWSVVQMFNDGIQLFYEAYGTRDVRFELGEKSEDTEHNFLHIVVKDRISPVKWRVPSQAQTIDFAP